jgi:hypothetical protein
LLLIYDACKKLASTVYAANFLCSLQPCTEKGEGTLQADLHQLPLCYNATCHTYAIVSCGACACNRVQVLHDVGEKHGVSASCVAARWVLQQPGVAAIVLGARNATHIRVGEIACMVQD